MPEGHLDPDSKKKKYNFFISNIWESGPGLNVSSVPTFTQQTLLYHGAGTGLHPLRLETLPTDCHPSVESEAGVYPLPTGETESLKHWSSSREAESVESYR